jgi:hypothetical protein
VIRVIVATVNSLRAANVGGPVDISYRSFDIAAPDLEAFMGERKNWSVNALQDRTIIGVELLPETGEG